MGEAGAARRLDGELMLPIAIKLALVGGAAYLATKGAGSGDRLVEGSPPKVGKYWRWPDASPNFFLPPLFLNHGGSLTGVYDPEQTPAKLVAVVDKAREKSGAYFVTTLSPSAEFPARLP